MGNKRQTRRFQSPGKLRQNDSSALSPGRDPASRERSLISRISPSDGCQKMIAGNIIVESRFLTESGKLFFPAVINKPVDFGADFYFQPVPAGSPAGHFPHDGQNLPPPRQNRCGKHDCWDCSSSAERTAAGNIFVHDQVVADTDLPPAEFFGPVKHFFNRVVPVGKNGMGVITEVLHQRFNLQRLV